VKSESLFLFRTMWRSVSLLICTLLCMISLSEADCKMTFFPNEINSPAGVRQMLSSKLGEIRQQTIGDPYDIRSKSKFNFAVQLLCKWGFVWGCSVW